VLIYIVEQFALPRLSPKNYLLSFYQWSYCENNWAYRGVYSVANNFNE